MGDPFQQGTRSCSGPGSESCQNLGDSILILLGLFISINIGINVVTLLWYRFRGSLTQIFHSFFQEDNMFRLAHSKKMLIRKPPALKQAWKPPISQKPPVGWKHPVYQKHAVSRNPGPIYQNSAVSPNPPVCPSPTTCQNPPVYQNPAVPRNSTVCEHCQNPSIYQNPAVPRNPTVCEHCTVDPVIAADATPPGSYPQHSVYSQDPNQYIDSRLPNRDDKVSQGQHPSHFHHDWDSLRPREQWDGVSASPPSPENHFRRYLGSPIKRVVAKPKMGLEAYVYSIDNAEPQNGKENAELGTSGYSPQLLHRVTVTPLNCSPMPSPGQEQKRQVWEASRGAEGLPHTCPPDCLEEPSQDWVYYSLEEW